MKNKIEYNITTKGSLGLLALGDIGLISWRNVRDKVLKTEKEEKKIDEK